MSKHILLVDDDALMRRSLAFNLEQAGFRASSAANAEDALLLARQDPPDLILLDIGLPGMDGLEAVRRFKELFQGSLPVIFVTARRRNLDQVIGLELGADDYISKPFDVDVLIARIKAVLRRPTAAASQPAVAITVGRLQLDPASHTVRLGEKYIDLSPREFKLLQVLALTPNRVHTIDELLASVWGAEFTGQPQVVYVHMRWLREKLELDPQHPTLLLTVRGVGYKLVGGV